MFSSTNSCLGSANTYVWPVDTWFRFIICSAAWGLHDPGRPIHDRARYAHGAGLRLYDVALHVHTPGRRVHE